MADLNWDGLDVIRHELPTIVALIAASARWADVETFRRLPLWYPETARRQPIFKAGWAQQMTNTSRATGVTVDKFEANERAGRALALALGWGSAKPSNWTVCHIWGYDDASFVASGGVVRDPRFYSCVANMVWLPTPLKGFTDAVDEVKQMLRVCAYHHFGWACEHDDVREQAAAVRSGAIPEGYPETWPTAERRVTPPGVVPFSPKIAQAIDARKSALRAALTTNPHENFPREQVEAVLRFWSIDLGVD